MKKTYLIFIITTCIILFFAVSVWYYVNHKQSTEAPSTTEEISLSNVQRHNQPDSCWIIVGTKVYSLTRYIASHPDDTVYKPYCGQTATEQIVGSTASKESAKAYEQLSTYYIGILVP